MDSHVLGGVKNELEELAAEEEEEKKKKKLALKGEGSDHFLTKEQLLELDRKEPGWRRIRNGLIAAFWVIWVVLVVASALVIVFTPRSPPRPEQHFWQSKVGYWINPFAFRDSNGDLVGDLQGVIKSADYIAKEVGAGFIILTPFTPNFPRKLQKEGIFSFEEIHPFLGSMTDFLALVRIFKSRGMHTVVSLNFNSIPLNHVLAKPQFLKKASPNDRFSRAGSGYAEVLDGNEYYSTYGNGSGQIDLDLTRPETLEEIKKATRFWMAKGADGIMLDDAAFFVEEGECAGKEWFGSYPHCKMFTSGSLKVIQELRRVVDEVSAATSRPRALLVDPGNIGFPPSTNKLVDGYLGSKDAPGAHLIITRHFTFMRGGTLAHNYALVAASPSDRPFTDLLSAAAIFLLPGTPIIFAGSELGWQPSSTLPPSRLYPFGEVPVVDDVASHLPMPWDSRGEGFSEAFANATEVFKLYAEKCEIRETVESSLAAARGPSIFSLTTSLGKLYQNSPVLQWGQVELNDTISKTWMVRVFKRFAEGFDSIYVVIKGSRNTATILDFSKDCTKITPIFEYPVRNPLLPINAELPNTKVYIGSVLGESLYLFKCAN